eukprot:scaffold9418_cov41-Attheya_sp.AAC.1
MSVERGCSSRTRLLSVMIVAVEERGYIERGCGAIHNAMIFLSGSSRDQNKKAASSQKAEFFIRRNATTAEKMCRNQLLRSIIIICTRRLHIIFTPTPTCRDLHDVTTPRSSTP